MAKKKAQTTVIFILLVIMIFGGILLFLLSVARTGGDQTEYRNFYVHNLLLTLLRTDTGYYTDSDCKLVSDAIACTFLGGYCSAPEGPSQPCEQVVVQNLTNLTNQFELIRKNYRYLFIAEPQWATGTSIEIGDTDLRTEKTEKIVANEFIQKVFGGNSYVIEVRLLVAKK